MWRLRVRLRWLRGFVYPQFIGRVFAGSVIRCSCLERIVVYVYNPEGNRIWWSLVSFVGIRGVCCCEKGVMQKLSEISTRMKRHVRFKLKDEKPTVWVGKEGLTPRLTREIDNQLGKQKMVKIRILPSALHENSAHTIAMKAAEQTGSALVEVRGHVFILYRRHKKPQP